MFVELLVASSCIYGTAGCREATNAYYEYNQDLKQFTKSVEEYGKKLTRNHEWIVYAATPVYAIASGQTARFQVYKHTIFGVNPKDKSVLIEWSY
jgi:hypothetical protein